MIGIGETRLIHVGDAPIAEINRERPLLTICKDGCEVECREPRDGWRYHYF